MTSLHLTNSNEDHSSTRNTDEYLLPIVNNLQTNSSIQHFSFNKDTSDYTNNWLGTLSTLPSLVPSTESTVDSPALSEILISPFTTLSTLPDNNQAHQLLQADQDFLQSYKFENLNLGFVPSIKDCPSEQDCASYPQTSSDLADMIKLPNEFSGSSGIQQENFLGLFDPCKGIESNQVLKTKMPEVGLIDLFSSRQNWNVQSTFAQSSTNLHSFSYGQSLLENVGPSEILQRQYDTELSGQIGGEPMKGVEKRRQSKTFEDVIEYFSFVQNEQGPSSNNRLRRRDSFNNSTSGLQKQRLIKRHRSHTDASSLYARQSTRPPLPVRRCPSNDQFNLVGLAASNALKGEKSDSFASSVIDKTTIRDEQNRQKSKRYYERKKAQNVATTALCTALDAWQAIFSTSSQTIELPEVENKEDVIEALPSSPSQRKKLYKIAQRNEETRQIRTIMSSAKRLEGLLKSTSSSEIAKIVIMHRQNSRKREKSTIEMYDHLSTLEAGMCIWLDHLQSWSDLVLAEKRLADMLTGRPVQRLVSLLSNIS